MKILFVCTGNACRSQIAEGWARKLGPKDWEFKSAGTHPAGLLSRTVESMKEVGIDISGQTSKRVTDELIKWADYVITLCDFARDCIFLPPSVNHLHWPMPDPVSFLGTDKKSREAFTRTREMIREKLEDFFKLQV